MCVPKGPKPSLDLMVLKTKSSPLSGSLKSYNQALHYLDAGQDLGHDHILPAVS